MAANDEIEKWFHQYSDDVYSYLAYYIGSLDVDDLVQETFLRALKGQWNFQGYASPKTWLCTIARHVAIDTLRKTKPRQRFFNTDDSILSSVASNDPSPEAFILQNDAKRELYTAIQQLKANYRDVVILRGILEFSVMETANLLQWPEAKVRTVYHRGLKSLKKKLSQGMTEEVSTWHL